MITESRRFVRPAAMALAAATVVSAALAPARAQQLEPRAYSPSPVGVNFAGVTAIHSSGDVVFDATSPFSDVTAKVYSFAPFYARTFSFFGRSSSFAVLMPYSSGYVEGNVGEEFRRADRNGLADVMMRWSVNIIGVPAMSPKAFAARKQGTIFGTSLTVTAPTGEYDPSHLINLGTNRWAVKPELGVAQPVGNWWLEFYAGLWLFSANPDYYQGQMRRQDPMGVVQGHVVRVFRRSLWVSLDATYYWGGGTSLDGVNRFDRQETTRIGTVVSVPVTKAQSIKFAYAKGATARLGSKLDTVGLTWQYTFLDKPRPPAD